MEEQMTMTSTASELNWAEDLIERWGPEVMTNLPPPTGSKRVRDIDYREPRIRLTNDVMIATIRDAWTDDEGVLYEHLRGMYDCR